MDGMAATTIAGVKIAMGIAVTAPNTVSIAVIASDRSSLPRA
jgi:hypothetical protein